jgi:hypothetical protein
VEGALLFFLGIDKVGLAASRSFFLSPFQGVLASWEAGQRWQSWLDILLKSGRAPRRYSIFDAKILLCSASG